MTFTLLRKDFRLLRPVLVGVGLMILAMYGVLPARNAVQDLEVSQVVAANGGLWFGYLMAQGLGIVEGFVLPALVTAAALATGAALAGERRRRTAEFVAMLPASRRRTTAAKLAVVSAVILACVGLPIAARVAGRWIDWRLGVACRAYWQQEAQAKGQPTAALAERPFEFSIASEVDGLAVFVATVATVAGVGWLASSLLRSPVVTAALAACAGAVYLSLLQQRFNVDSHTAIFPTQLLRGSGVGPDSGLVWALRRGRASAELVATTFGVAAAAVGTLVQLRRVSP